VVVRGRDALNLLGVPWHVRGDGITVFAARPSGDVATEERILVEYRNDAIGYRVVNCEDPGAFLPGLTFEGETIGEVVFSLSADDIKMHVWTRAASSAFAEAIRAVWRRLFPRAELQGVFSYVTVGGSSSGKHDLRSAKSRHLPDVKLCDSWGAAGVSADLAPGTRVLLAFADGDPSSPVVVAVEPRGGAGHVPVRAYHEATTSINMVTDSLGKVLVGDVTRAPVAKAIPVDAVKAALIAYTGAIAADPTLTGIVTASSGMASTLSGIPSAATTRLESA
jgi:hypothetical protein